MTRNLARTLEELAARGPDAREVGGKAAGLARLVAAGLPVPPGFALDRGVFDEIVRGLQLGESDDDIDGGLGRAASAVASTRLPLELARELEERARALGPRLIVRSSATVEDSAAAAAPGIFTSLGGLRPDDVPAAVTNVLSSALSPAAHAYLAARGLDPSALGMGVVIQRHVPCRCRGVAYSRARGAPSEIAIEVVRDDTATWAQAPRTGEPPQLGPNCPLEPHEVTRVARAAVAAEAAIGAETEGADVEWVLEDDTLWLVQARPIPPRSSIGDDAPPPSIFAPLVRRDPHAIWRWDAAHNPEPLSPAQIGLVERVDALEAIPFRLAVAGGYLYATSAGEPSPPPAQPLDEFFAGRIMPAVDAALAPAEAPGANLDTCLRAYEEVCRIYFADLTPAVDAGRRQLVELLRELGTDDPEGVAGELVLGSGAGGLEPLLERAARGEASRDAVARELAPLAPAWDVAAPTYAENLAWLEDRLDALARGARPRREEQRTRAEARAAAIRGAIAEPAMHERFDHTLERARAASAIAEVDDRLFFRAQAAVRRALLALARAWHLDDPSEIFWLRLDEVVARSRTGEVPDPEHVHQRAARARAQADAARRWAMPLAVAGGRPVAPTVSAGPGRWVGRGTGGHARGRALRIDGPGALAGDAEGRVAVAAAITPASVLAVRGAKALIAEHGGALGHAAALARELGIPCVVGCLGAARGLADGDLVLVDADAGVVVRLS